MNKLCLIFLGLLCTFYCVAQEEIHEGWTFRTAIPLAQEDIKTFVDDVRASLPPGTPCSYSAKSGEICITVAAGEDPELFISTLSQKHLYLVPTGNTLPAEQRAFMQSQKEKMAAQYPESTATVKPEVTQAQFDAAPQIEKDRLIANQVIIK